MNPTIFFYITVGALTFFAITMLSGHGGHHGGAHAPSGGHDGIGHHGFGHHGGHAGSHDQHAHSQDTSLHFVTFRTITLFVAGFGIAGYFASVNLISQFLILVAAVGGGFATSYVGYAALNFLYKRQGSVVLTADSYIYSEAVVDVSIEAGGKGRISSTEFGRLENFMAVSKDGKAIPIGTPVRITEVQGSTAVVEPLNILPIHSN